MVGDTRYFLEDYSRALRAGAASLFVGAGLSIPSGLPSWDDLLRPMRRGADVPGSIVDPTVVAEYISQHYGQPEFFRMLLSQFPRTMAPSATHQLIARLPFRNIWTTNYDTLLEDSHPHRFVIASDSSYAQARELPRSTRIVKMHGSIGVDENDLRYWRADPIITRSHFETYPVEHPLFWADLTASFLTSTFLFVGFSFNDPNIEVLLRLSRTIKPEIRRSPHYAVMRRPPTSAGADAGRAHDLRVMDLERAGILVVQISDYDEVEVLLNELIRLMLPPNIFISGSELSPEGAGTVLAIGARLAARSSSWNAVTLGGAVANAFASGMKVGMGASYDAERVRFFFRDAGAEGVQHLPERVGTAVYSEEPRDRLVPKVLAASRGMFVVGGREGTALEVDVARGLDIPIVALPTEGGVAAEVHNEQHRRLDAIGSTLQPPPLSLDQKTRDKWVEEAVDRLARVLSLEDDTD